MVRKNKNLQLKNFNLRSPVSTAYYKLLPSIEIKEPIEGENAKALVEKCPLKVFSKKNNKAYVKNLRDCTSCRECIREVEEF